MKLWNEFFLLFKKKGYYDIQSTKEYIYEDKRINYDI